MQETNRFQLKSLSQVLTVERIANLHLFTFEANHMTEHNHHPFYELVFVTEGEMHVTSDGFSGVLQKNQMLIHRPDEVHFLTCPPQISPTVIIIGFSCTGYALDVFSDHAVTLGEQETGTLAQIVKEGRNIFAPPYDIPTFDMKKKENIPFGSEQLLKIYLEFFLIELVRAFGLHSERAPAVTACFPIDEAIKYIDENFLEKTSIDEMAFLFRTNRATFCKEFKRATGKTLINYIADKKIALAKEKLANSNDTVTHIAYEMNFVTVHYFTKFFKKHTGFTPGDYKKRLLGKHSDT